MGEWSHAHASLHAENGKKSLLLISGLILNWEKGRREGSNTFFVFLGGGCLLKSMNLCVKTGVWFFFGEERNILKTAKKMRLNVQSSWLIDKFIVSPARKKMFIGSFYKKTRDWKCSKIFETSRSFEMTFANQTFFWNIFFDMALYNFYINKFFPFTYVVVNIYRIKCAF